MSRSTLVHKSSDAKQKELDVLDGNKAWSRAYSNGLRGAVWQDEQCIWPWDTRVTSWKECCCRQWLHSLTCWIRVARLKPIRLLLQTFPQQRYFPSPLGRQKTPT